MENEEVTIDLMELASVLWNKAYIIIIAILVAALVAFGGTKLLITPKYTSTTSMYMLTKTAGSTGVTSTDLATGSQLTQDYIKLATSRGVLEEVIDKLGLEETTGELASTIAATNDANTRIMTISVQNEDPEQAQAIADAVRESVSKKIKEIMDIDAVNTIDEANLPTTPSSPSVMKNTALGGILGMILAMAVIIVIYMLDDTIKTPDDVEDYLGLNVLTAIPIQEGEIKEKRTRKEKKGNHRRGRRTQRKAKKK